MRDYRSHRSHLLEHNPRPWARVEIARCIAPVGDRRKRRYIVEAHEPRGVAQSGSASGLGPEGPGFKSRRPDFPTRYASTSNLARGSGEVLVSPDETAANALLTEIHLRVLGHPRKSCSNPFVRLA